MYTWFYDFSDEPFNVNPEPKFLYLSKTHQQALDSMIEGINERREFTVILGDVGAGKTTLIQRLLKILDKKVKTVPIFHPPSSFEGLLEEILRELGAPAISRNKVSLVRQLNDCLQNLASDETLAIIIDEAQDLTPEVIKELCLLPTPEVVSAQKFEILFVGQPELKGKLDSADVKGFRHKLEVVSQLRPLDDKECQGYIAHRLREVGSEILKVFTPEAISLICQYSRGNPRTINILCDNAFLIGYSLSKKRVDSGIVDEALEDLDFVGQKEFPGWPSQQEGKFGGRGVKGENPFFRKIGYSLLALIGVGVIIFFGRLFLKGPEERPATRFPIQPQTSREKIALDQPGANTEMNRKVGPKPEEGSKRPAPVEPKWKPSAPSAGPEGKSTASSQTAEREPTAPSEEAKLSISLPAKGVKKEPEDRGAAMKPMPAPSNSQTSAAGAKARAEKQAEKSVVVKAGDSIYTIAAKNYRVANTSVVDEILEFNPEIGNPNRLMVNRKIRLPEITEASLIIDYPDGTCKVRLGTFLRPEYSTFLQGQPALQGKKVEILARKLPSGENWYRVLAGKFSNREEGLKVIHGLRQKGLSPYFPGFKENK